MGPYFAGVFNPRGWGEHSDAITLEVMRIVLATGLFAIGVELPQSYMAKHAKSLLAMVIPTMAIGWVIVGGKFQIFYAQALDKNKRLSTLTGLIRALFPSLNFISCLAISACLTPTDPIICAAIVGELSGSFLYEGIQSETVCTGGKFARKHVPIHLRRLISAESAANDGLAYPFLTLTLYLTLDKNDGVAIGHWFLIGWLCEFSSCFLL